MEQIEANNTQTTQELQNKVAELTKELQDLKHRYQIVDDASLQEDEKLKILVAALQKNDEETEDMKENFQAQLKNLKKELDAKVKEQTDKINQKALEASRDLRSHKDLTDKIDNLERENLDMKKINDDLNKEIQNLKQQNSQLQDSYRQLGQEFDKQQDLSKAQEIKITNERDAEKKALEEEKKAYKDDLDSKLAAMQTRLDNAEKLYEKLKSEKEGLEKQVTKEKYESGTDPKDFYDGIIRVNGLNTLTNGWDITFKDGTEFNKLINSKGIALSVVGNYNKGKTFLLELLSGQKAPHGFSVSTEGISVKYLRDEHFKYSCPIIALDTQGGSIPIETASIAGMNEQQNAEQTEKIENKFKALLRDHHATEDLLQNFIMEIATILIIVVSDLTFDDQRLITKIQNKFRNDREKNLIVLHNLYHCHTQKQVEGKIENLIRKSFALEESSYFNTSSECNSVYYEERLKSGMRVIHLVLAKHGSPAGDYYNASTIDYLKSRISGAPQTKLDVVAEFGKYLNNNLLNYIETNIDYDKKLVITEENNRPAKIILKEVEDIELKSISSDELGLVHTFSQKYQPTYTVYLQNKTLNIKIECPGKYEKPKVKLENNAKDFRIIVYGQKIHDDKDTSKKLVDNRKEGDFDIITGWIKKEKYDIKRGVKDFQNQDGSIIITWDLTEESDFE